MENTHQFLSLSKVPLILTSIVTNLQIFSTAVHSSTTLSDDVNPVGTGISYCGKTHKKESDKQTKVGAQIVF